MAYESDKDLILALASSEAPLDKSPKHNWVEDAGGLPPYVRKLARGIMKNGHDLSSAISIAISRIKVWAAGGGKVNATTRAKAAKALAQWEKTKAASHVKMTFDDGTDKFDYLALSNITSFNTDIVRSAWDAEQRQQRAAYDAAHPQITGNDRLDYGFPYEWICELGTDYIITKKDVLTGEDRYRYPYTVNDDYEVTFGDPVKIIQIWVEDDDDDLTADEYAALSGVGDKQLALSHIVRTAERLKSSE